MNIRRWKASALGTPRPSRILRSAGLAACLALTLPTAGWSQTRPPSDLAELALEDLMNIEVTSVSKREQKISKVAAAVFVISQEDIRRSGARSIPDLLRMVPGLYVARVNSSTWAITARGFNGQYANKLLVLMDGRTVYDPSNAGVYWDRAYADDKPNGLCVGG